MTDREKREHLSPQVEITAAQLLASSLDPRRPDFAQKLEEQIDKGGQLDDILLSPDNPLVRSTEHLFQIEPQQFSSIAQPYVEAIINEAEATRSNGQPVIVDVNLDLKAITIKGNGKGMDFKKNFVGQVVRPHSGDEGKVRGQFGQGTKSYWLAGEQVRISSVPENAASRGFDVSLNNNSGDKTKGKTIALELKKPQQNAEAGTTVVFDQPMANGKPISEDDLQYITEYIKNAVEHVYFAEIRLTVGGKTEVVNKRVLEAPRYRSGNVEMIVIPSADSEAPSRDVLSAIDVAGESLWQENNFSTAEQLVINFPRQRMKAEARSFNHLALLAEDEQATFDLINQIILDEHSPHTVAKYLSAISRQLDHLNEQTVQFTEAKKLIAKELSRMADAGEVTLFTAWTGTEQLVFPDKNVLVGTTVAELISEKLRNAGLQRVEFSGGITMYASAFQSEKNDEFFLKIGPAACVNISIFEKAKNQNSQVKNSLRTALNTSLSHYNYTHPLASDRIAGEFLSTEYSKQLTAAENTQNDSTSAAIVRDSSIVADSPTKQLVLDSLSPRALEKIDVAEVVSTPLTASEQEFVDKFMKQVSWPEKMVQNVNREMEVYIAFIVRVSKMNGSDRDVAHLSESELRDALTNLWGDSHQRENLIQILSALKPEQLLKQTENTYQEIFGEFLNFWNESDPKNSGEFRKLLSYVDTERNDSKFDGNSSTGSHFGSILMIWLSGRESEYFQVNEFRFGRTGVMNREIFLQNMHQAWSSFVEEKPEEAKLLRFSLLTYHVAHQNDIFAMRTSLLEDDKIKSVYSRDAADCYSEMMSRKEGRLRASRNKVYPNGLSEDQVQSRLKMASDMYLHNAQTPTEKLRNPSERLLLNVVCDEQLLAECRKSSGDFLEIYAVVQQAFNSEAANGYEDTDSNATEKLDQTIALISFIRTKAHVSISEIVRTHQNCLKLGIPSILSLMAKDLTYYKTTSYHAHQQNFQSLYFFEVLGKEQDEKRLALLGALVHQLSDSYSVELEEVAEDIYKRVMVLSLPLLEAYKDESDLLAAANTIVKIAQKDYLFELGRVSIHDRSVTNYLYLFSLQPEAFPLFQKLMEKDDRALSVLIFFMSNKGLPSIGNSYNSDRPYIDPGVMFLHIAAAEKLLNHLPENADLRTLERNIRGEIVVNVDGERTTVDTEFNFLDTLDERVTRDSEWNPPTDGSAIEGDLIDLTAVYLSLKADGKDLTQFSVAEVAELTEKMKQTVSEEQRKYYQRRLISTIQSQDANPYRFYREWYQNSQNAALSKNENDRYAVTINGLSANKSGQLRRFTKMLDFNGMSSDKAIWNLGTSPGFKEGAADEKSLERFHAGWLTSLNGASEVRVRTSTGNGKILHRRFLPIYEQNGQENKLTGVKQQTWEVSDPSAMTAFTEMTRFELESDKAIFQDPLVPVIRQAARYHDLQELGMYEIYDDVRFSVTDIDLSTSQINQLNESVGSFHHRKLGISETNSRVLNMQELGSFNKPLVRRGEWGFDLVPINSTSNQDLLVQGGFALGEHWPEEITRLIPAEVLQAFHETRQVLILRIPKDVAPNKARDSINNAAAFISENKALITSLLIEAVAQAIAKMSMSEKILLSYDAGEDFIRRYPLKDEKSRQTVADLAAGKTEAAAAVLDAENPGREISKMALHLPLFRLPKLLPGIPAESLKREYSLFDLMVIRAGAAYLLSYEMKNADTIGKLISQLVEKDEVGKPVIDSDGTMVLSQDALVRMAWMARPEVQLMNRARLAKFKVQEALDSNPLWDKLQSKMKVLSAVGKFVRRRKNEAAQEEQSEKDEHVPLTAEATKEEIAALFKGEGRKHLQLASEVNTVLETEKNANVLPIVTLRKNQKPKADEKAYFGLVDFTVDAVNKIDSRASFTTENIGFYLETEVVSLARAGGRILGINMSDVDGAGNRYMPPMLFKRALDQDNMSILVGEKIGATIAHEVAHNQESNWTSDSRTDHPTHDLTFRRMEDANFRKLTQELFALDETGVAKIQTVWQNLQSKYASQDMASGSEFYNRLAG